MSNKKSKATTGTVNDVLRILQEIQKEGHGEDLVKVLDTHGSMEITQDIVCENGKVMLFS